MQFWYDLDDSLFDKEFLEQAFQDRGAKVVKEDSPEHAEEVARTKALYKPPKRSTSGTRGDA